MAIRAGTGGRLCQRRRHPELVVHRHQSGFPACGECHGPRDILGAFFFGVRARIARSPFMFVYGPVLNVPCVIVVVSVEPKQTG